MAVRKRKSKARKTKSYFSKFTKTLKKLLLRLLIITISLALFSFIIYKSYIYATKPIDYDKVPYIKNDSSCKVVEFNENDGLIFSNQDKKVYESFKNKRKNYNQRKFKSEKIVEEFSHQQIFDIVEDIKKDEDVKKEYQAQEDKPKEAKKDKIKVVRNQRKVKSKSSKQINKKSVFDVL